MQQTLQLSDIQTIAGVCDGYEAFILTQIATKYNKPLLFVASDGAQLMQTAPFLPSIRTQWQILEYLL